MGENNAILKTVVFQDTKDASKVMSDYSSKFKETCQTACRSLSQLSFVHQEKRIKIKMQACYFGAGKGKGMVGDECHCFTPTLWGRACKG